VAGQGRVRRWLSGCGVASRSLLIGRAWLMFPAAVIDAELGIIVRLS